GRAAQGAAVAGVAQRQIDRREALHQVVVGDRDGEGLAGFAIVERERTRGGGVLGAGGRGAVAGGVLDGHRARAAAAAPDRDRGRAGGFVVRVAGRAEL